MRLAGDRTIRQASRPRHVMAVNETPTVRASVPAGRLVVLVAREVVGIMRSPPRSAIKFVRHALLWRRARSNQRPPLLSDITEISLVVPLETVTQQVGAPLVSRFRKACTATPLCAPTRGQSNAMRRAAGGRARPANRMSFLNLATIGKGSVPGIVKFVLFGHASRSGGRDASLFPCATARQRSPIPWAAGSRCRLHRSLGAASRGRTRPGSGAGESVLCGAS
jgi:hypothetical protein